ncbi:helix-turn-helix transcriptional regulator [Streptomyces sp. NBC_00239]|uniref:helix-turn-helix transcriptional regulator n=1 Tax=Streptomyces sp. NBC_00239 TaxID=2903640 RepID=UPI002E2948E8|nr:helix-turn-helix transcriptional regulator [Streptomyces sp. NBC_00239]
MEETQGERAPGHARNAAEFVTLMRALKERSGLTYRQLEERAAEQGEVLARSTLAGVLGGRTLPRPELLAAFVRACGDADRVGEWLTAWSTVAERQSAAARPETQSPDPSPPSRTSPLPHPSHPSPSSPPSQERSRERPQEPPQARPPAESGTPAHESSRTDPSDADPAAAPTPAAAPAPGTAFELTPEPAGPQSRSGRGRVPWSGRVAAGVAVLLAVAAAGAFAALSADGTSDTPPQQLTRTVTLPSGWVRILPLSAPGMCLTDGRVPDSRYTPLVAVQRPCSQAGPQTTLLERMGGDLYRIQWRHPDYGTGCLKALTDGPGFGLLEPMDDCKTDSRFHVEPSGPRGSNQYVFRVDGQGCVGIKGSVTTAGAEAVMERCVGRGGQLFAIEPAN